MIATIATAIAAIVLAGMTLSAPAWALGAVIGLARSTPAPMTPLTETRRRRWLLWLLCTGGATLAFYATIASFNLVLALLVPPLAAGSVLSAAVIGMASANEWRGARASRPRLRRPRPVDCDEFTHWPRSRPRTEGR